jgi:hypothetical protein
VVSRIVAEDETNLKVRAKKRRADMTERSHSGHGLGTVFTTEGITRSMSSVFSNLSSKSVVAKPEV